MHSFGLFCMQQHGPDARLAVAILISVMHLGDMRVGLHCGEDDHNRSGALHWGQTLLWS